MCECPMCNASVFTMCPTGKRLLKQCKRSWKNFLNGRFTSRDAFVHARTGLESLAAAFRKHTGHGWSTYP